MTANHRGSVLESSHRSLRQNSHVLACSPLDAKRGGAARPLPRVGPLGSPRCRRLHCLAHQPIRSEDRESWIVRVYGPRDGTMPSAGVSPAYNQSKQRFKTRPTRSSPDSHAPLYACQDQDYKEGEGGVTASPIGPRSGVRGCRKVGRGLLRTGLGPMSRRQTHTLLTLAALLLGAATVQAQAAPNDTLRLSLNDVLARVRLDHPAVLAGAATIRAAEARAAQLRRYTNPSLDLERVTFSEVEYIGFLQPIRWPWESSALKGVGAAEVTVAAAAAEQERRVIALDATERLVDGLRDGRSLAIAVEAESLAQSVVERVGSARALGQVGDLQVLQAQVSLDAARRTKVGAEADLRASTVGIALLLGNNSATPIAFVGDLATLLPVGALDSALVHADSVDPESARLEAEAERARQEGRLARARRWPELAVGPAVSISRLSTFGISFGLGIPLWNRQGDAMRAAAADRESALAHREARQRELSILVLEARSTTDRTERELSLLRTGELARAEQTVSLAARALQQGGPYMTIWLTARQAYLDARRAELDLEWQAARARLLLRHLSGTLLAEEVP
jgi:outer membrane protein, heavy metal efflux system